MSRQLINKHNIDSINEKLSDKGIKYTCVEYNGYSKNSLFLCPEDGHGTFTARPDLILSYNTNCHICTNCVHQYDIDSINEKLSDKGIKYTCVEYNGSRTNSTFYCEEHNYYFVATPDNVLTKKTNCPYCSGRMRWNLNLLNTHLHNTNRYLLFHDFKSTITNSVCECLVCGHGKNGEWTPIPGSILYGRGCPVCAKSGFDPSKPASLYYIKIIHEEDEHYKIGITNRTVEERFYSENIKYDILYCYTDIGEIVKRKEIYILQNNKQWRYDGPPILKRTKNKEIFTIDIFNGNYDDINIIGQ